MNESLRCSEGFLAVIGLFHPLDAYVHHQICRFLIQIPLPIEANFPISS